MNSRLFIHIGPPKTATTSLQYALCAASSKLSCVHYGGVFQPRPKNEGSLAKYLHNAVAGQSIDDHETDQALKDIREHLASGRSVVISEEMFLVTQRACTFESKIGQLAKLLKGIPTTIVLTLRDPRDGLPSLYQELFHSLPLAEKLSFANFSRGSRAKCYDYVFIIEMLRFFGFTDIKIISYDDICKGSIAVSDILGPHITSTDVLYLGRQNVSQATLDGRVLPRVTLKTVGNLRPLQILIYRSGVRKNGLYRRLVDLLDRITLTPGGSQSFCLPRDVAGHFTQSYDKARKWAIADKKEINLLQNN